MPLAVNQAMGTMKLNNGTAPVPRTNGLNTVPHPGGRGGVRGRGRGRGGPGHHHNHNHHQQQPRVEIKIPASDFDFEASNKLFDKNSTASQYLQQQPYAGAAFNSSPPEKDKAGRVSPALAGTLKVGKKDGEVTKKEPVYNPSKSFFDNISSDLTAKKPARAADTSKAGAQDDGAGGGEATRGRGRGRGGPSYGKMRRDEEREKNVETFGEPGGVGLLGPGSYVGGYGGYRGRRKRGGGATRGGRGGAGAPRAVVVGFGSSFLRYWTDISR
jgi:protein LSM14